MNRGRGFTIIAGCILLFCFSDFAAAQHHREEWTEFGVSNLPPLDNLFRPATVADVKRFWISRIPEVYPPSRSSSGYAYEMPHYRSRLEQRNCLVNRINEGHLDQRAECEAIRHNIRYYRSRGNQERVEELEWELLRREAMSRGDVRSVLKLDEHTRQGGEELATLVREQAALIEALRREIEALKTERLRNP